jgi:hypothetical protein
MSDEGDPRFWGRLVSRRATATDGPASFHVVYVPTDGAAWVGEADDVAMLRTLVETLLQDADPRDQLFVFSGRRQRLRRSRKGLSLALADGVEEFLWRPGDEGEWADDGRIGLGGDEEDAPAVEDIPGLEDAPGVAWEEYVEDDDYAEGDADGWA